jgi:hypothetical protein
MSLKIENSRRNDESRPVCMDLYQGRRKRHEAAGTAY